MPPPHDHTTNPILMVVHPTSSVRPYILAKCTCGHYVVSLDNNKPITPNGLNNLLEHLQICKRTTQVSLVLHPTDPSLITNYESTQSVHDGVTHLHHHFIMPN